MITELGFNFNGVHLTVSDFPRTLQGWVAFSIAFIQAVHPSSKEAALELLMHEAEQIIKQVEKGEAPE